MPWQPSSDAVYSLRVGCSCRPCNLAREHMAECSTSNYPCRHVTIEPSAPVATPSGPRRISFAERLRWLGSPPSTIELRETLARMGS